MKKNFVDVESLKAAAVEKALEEAERRHVRELQASLKRQKKEMDDDRNRQLNRQKMVSINFIIISIQYLKISLYLV